MKKYILTVLLVLFIPLFIVACNDNIVNDNPFQPIVKSEGDLSIHFLELGNKYTGDSIYIKYNDIDILIDAGSRQASATTIIAYIDNYIQDGILEFVIATHAHQDHIAGFYSTYYQIGILEYYKIGTIIDFPRTNNTTTTYNNYVKARTQAVERGAVHFTALQCYREEGGAQRIFHLEDDLYLEILYNYYYEEYSENENNYSVCVRIIQGDKQYLFTGDLEEEGEEKLVEYYAEHHGGLGQVVLFKGGHHGSNTANSEILLAEIRPQYVCVCTCAGTYEYTFYTERNRFPSQGFMDRVAPYTNEVYITTLIESKEAYDRGEFKSFNGNIVFLVSNGHISIHCSANDYKLKDSPWLLNQIALGHKTMPPQWE